MTENIYSELQQNSSIYHFTASGPCSTVTVSLWAEHFPFVTYVMWMNTDCTSGRSIKVAAEQTAGMTSPVHTAVALNTAVTAVGTDFTAQCCVVAEMYSNKLVTHA